MKKSQVTNPSKLPVLPSGRWTLQIIESGPPVVAKVMEGPEKNKLFRLHLSQEEQVGLQKALQHGSEVEVTT